MRIFSLPYPELVSVLRAFIPESMGKSDGDGGNDDDDSGFGDQNLPGLALSYYVDKCLQVLHSLAHQTDQSAIITLRESVAQATDILGSPSVTQYFKPFSRLTNMTQFKVLLMNLHGTIANHDLDAAACAKMDEVKDLLNELRSDVGDMLQDTAKQTPRAAFTALEAI